jgi:prepilin-type processing-associated H-X9-DG protein
MMYANRWNGWVVPPLRGRELASINDRWPAIVFEYDKTGIAEPPVLICASDWEPETHRSYLLNYHLVDRSIRYSSKGPGGLPSTQIVVASEKKTDRDDYYLNVDDYYTVLELYRHGLSNGANILFLDFHVSTEAPKDGLPGRSDPWDFPP